jgi:hypothetical protein
MIEPGNFRIPQKVPWISLLATESRLEHKKSSSLTTAAF